MGCGGSKSQASEPKPAGPSLLEAEPAPSGKTGLAVVTGAGSGIGKALTLLLAKNGMKVLGVDKNETALKDLKGDGIAALPADLDTEEGIAAVVETVQWCGGDGAVNLLVLNAGYLIAKPLLGMDRASMDAMIGAHINSPIFLTQALVPNLKKAGDARVLLTCGGILDSFVPTIGGYSATKAAMKTLRLALRDECAEFAAVGICFPGPTKTPLWDSALADPDWPLREVFGPRFENGDAHTADETAEWMAALLNKTQCENQAFKERDHNIDNPEHQCGVKVTLTSEGKAFQSEPEAPGNQPKLEEALSTGPPVDKNDVLTIVTGAVSDIGKALAGKPPNEVLAVVTGAASGIGKALALLLAQKGFMVLAVDKNEQTLQELNDDMILTCCADIGTPEGVDALAKAVGDGGVDILALNAGSLAAKPVLGLDRSSLKAMSDAHICAPIFVTQALQQNLKRAGSARILLTCGGGHDVHIPTFGGYGATKAAMKTVALHLRNECAELAAVGICFPGPTKTPLWDSALADPDWPLKEVFGARFENADVHTAEETAEWMAALFDKTRCDSQTFMDRDHNIDNQEHQCGVEVTLTTEGKAFQSKSETPGEEPQGAPPPEPAVWTEEKPVQELVRTDEVPPGGWCCC